MVPFAGASNVPWGRFVRLVAIDAAVSDVDGSVEPCASATACCTTPATSGAPVDASCCGSEQLGRGLPSSSPHASVSSSSDSSRDRLRADATEGTRRTGTPAAYRWARRADRSERPEHHGLRRTRCIASVACRGIIRVVRACRSARRVRVATGGAGRIAQQETAIRVPEGLARADEKLRRGGAHERHLAEVDDNISAEGHRLGQCLDTAACVATSCSPRRLTTTRCPMRSTNTTAGPPFVSPDAIAAMTRSCCQSPLPDARPGAGAQLPSPAIRPDT